MSLSAREQFKKNIQISCNMKKYVCRSVCKLNSTERNSTPIFTGNVYSLAQTSFYVNFTYLA